MLSKSLAFSIQDLLHQVALAMGDFWGDDNTELATFQKARIVAAPQLIEATRTLCIEILEDRSTGIGDSSMLKDKEVFIQLLTLCVELAKSIQSIVKSHNAKDIMIVCYKMNMLRQILSILAVSFSALVKLDKPHKLDELVLCFVVANSELYRGWIPTKGLSCILLQTEHDLSARDNAVK